MARTCFVTTILAVLVAEPALAHPGHGMPGWLHHGEAFGLAVIVIGALVAWRRASGRAPRRGDS
jgi:hypothetical protein